MKKLKFPTRPGLSIIDKAHYLLMNTNIPYPKISNDTGLSIRWLQTFNGYYLKGRDFGAKKIELLISYLTNDKE